MRNAQRSINDHETPIIFLEDPVRAVALVITTIVAVLLAGCGAVPGPAPTVNVPPAAPATPAAQPAPGAPAEPAGAKSERGNVIKKVGETAAFGPTQDQLQVKFVVDKITAPAKCTAPYAQASEHGTFVKLDLRVETTADLPVSNFYTLSPSEFSTVGADGVTESSIWTPSAAGCVDIDEQLPVQLAPSSKYRGSIVLDTKNRAGTLVFKPGFMSVGGWEWQYGAA